MFLFTIINIIIRIIFSFLIKNFWEYTQKDFQNKYFNSILFIFDNNINFPSN